MRGSPRAPWSHDETDRMIGRPASLRAGEEFEQEIMVLYRTEYMVDGT